MARAAAPIFRGLRAATNTTRRLSSSFEAGDNAFILSVEQIRRNTQLDCHSERSEESASPFTGCTDSSSSLRDAPAPIESIVQLDRDTIHLKRPTVWDTC